MCIRDRIMRWYSTGSVIEVGDKRWDGMLRKMGKTETPPGARAIVVLDVWKVTTSCGTGVPIIGEVQSLEEEMEVSIHSPQTLSLTRY